MNVIQAFIESGTLRKLPSLIILYLLFDGICYSQINNSNTYRVLFYNVENLFDTKNDSVTEDDEFTPSGNMHWTYNRYQNKLNNLFRVITAVGGWNPPDIIGLCETENEGVLRDLIHKTPLLKHPYRIIHENSDDRRGIDVALLYNSNTVHYIDHHCFSISQKGFMTRDILYFKALLSKDTCHFFVNHWPSRSGGQIESEPGRLAAAVLLKELTDSVFAENPHAKIISMGDYNDDPTNPSISIGLDASTNIDHIQPNLLFNISEAPASGKVKGSLKYRGYWNLFDQFIVSGSWLLNTPGLQIAKNGFHIADFDFLLIEDETYNGYKPFRTYNGYRYQGGFSDHLPVYIEIVNSE